MYQMRNMVLKAQEKTAPMWLLSVAYHSQVFIYWCIPVCEYAIGCCIRMVAFKIFRVKLYKVLFLFVDGKIVLLRRNGG